MTSISGSSTLITGGAGFIGSHLAERLLGLGASVTVFDRFDKFYDGKEANLATASKSKGFNLVRGDILDREVLRAASKGVDCVFHLAGQAGVGHSVKHPRETNEVNVTGTLNVLWGAKENGVRRVVNVSSSSVFGNPEYLPLDENHPKSPTSPYGVSKLAAEQYAKVFNRVYGFDAVTLRYFSVYGPRGRPDQVVHRFTEALRAGKPPVVSGDGSHTRDFTYVDDIVDATIRAGTVEGVAGEDFNIGFGARTSIRDLAAKVIALFGMTGTIAPEFVEASPGDFPHTQADNKKATRMLGWVPSVDLDHGLERYKEWFMKSTGGAN